MIWQLCQMQVYNDQWYDLIWLNKSSNVFIYLINNQQKIIRVSHSYKKNSKLFISREPIVVIQVLLFQNIKFNKKVFVFFKLHSFWSHCCFNFYWELISNITGWKRFLVMGRNCAKFRISELILDTACLHISILIASKKRTHF